LRRRPPNGAADKGTEDARQSKPALRLMTFDPLSLEGSA
jgi:hypothetical protein